jgi:hypothetical protein
MKTVFSALSLGFVLALGACLTRAAGPDEPAKGKVLILDNERTLEGDIERVGTQYRVRRSVGETWITGDRVLQLCPDLLSAYKFLRNRSNLNDADERLRLAEWCRQHDMRQQALTEVQEAVVLRPHHLPSRRLLDHLKQAAESPGGVAKAAAAEPELPTPPVDLTADALGLFATRVQPILMNTCATCHAADKGGKFKLTRSYESELGNRKVMQQNLAAVLAQVNLREPRISPLLTKAVSVHGSLAQAPLKNRQAPAYRALEDWVKLTLANNPTLHETVAGPVVPEGRAPAKSEATFAADVPAAPEPAAASPAGSVNPVATPAKPLPLDPFDPAVFNRQMHPDRQAAPKKP